MHCCRRLIARAVVAPAAGSAAAAIADGEAPINQCPPGGAAVIAALAQLLDRPVLPLNPAHGVERPPLVAWIDESRCIGCARVLLPCPGGRHRRRLQVHAHRPRRTLHGVRIVPAAPAPSIASEMRPGPDPVADQARINLQRFDAHTARLLQRDGERRRQLEAKKAAAPGRGTLAERGKAARHICAVARRQSGAAHRIAVSIAVRAPGRGDPLGAGDRQEREQGHGGVVSSRRHAGCPAGVGGRRPLASYIKSIGLYNSKAKNIRRDLPLSAGASWRHGARIARGTRALFPGVVVKTATVILNTAFGEPTIAVDTHIFRVANRTGLAPGKTVRAVEEKLLKFVPAEFLQDAHHWADLARPLYLQGAQPGLSDLPHRGPMRVSSQNP